MPQPLGLPPQKQPNVLAEIGLTFVAGFGLLALVGYLTNYGFSFVFVSPLVIGMMFGRHLRSSKTLLVLLSVIAVVGLVAAAMAAKVAGLLCGSILAIIIIVPFWIGTVLGGWRRSRIEDLRSSRSNRTTAILLLLSPLGSGLVEGNLPQMWGSETVETSRVVAGAPQEIWEAVVFFEEVELEPPLLTRIGLPRPLRTQGDIRRVGDLKTCTYDTGHLTKRITVYQPARLLAFDVIEQQGIEDRSIDLVSGSFRFEPAGPGRTRVTLATVYKPLLAARVVWQPFELRLATTLHEHVLDGIEWRLAGGDDQADGSR